MAEGCMLCGKPVAEGYALCKPHIDSTYDVDLIVRSAELLRERVERERERYWRDYSRARSDRESGS